MNLKNEAYTPSYFVDPIREFAKGFDFDPFSSDLANQTVKAKVYATAEKSAYLAQFLPAWHNSKSIWCNPPYSTKELRQAVYQVLCFKDNKEVYLLLNTDNSTEAYRQCLRRCKAIMLVSSRIKFDRPYSKPYSCPEMFAPYAIKSDQNDNPQTLFFFGTIERAYEFKKELSHLGKVFIND